MHHHTATQLVICDAAYHRLLHRRMRRRGIPVPVLPWYQKTRMIRISNDAMAELRRRATAQGRTLRAVLEDVVRRHGGAV